MEQTDTAAPETRAITLTYDGSEWVHHVKMPTEGQTVQILGLINAKGLANTSLTKEQQQTNRARAIKHVQVAIALAAGLHADKEEWEHLTLAMASGDADASVMFDVILGAMKAWSDDEEPEPNNRAERREATKRARRA